MLCFFNTLTGKPEEFHPLKKGEVRIYTCGPTVYDYSHIGNFRAYIFEDLLRRYLKFRGYRVIQVMNITDIDDKIIRGANEAGEDVFTFASRYLKAFFEDIDALRIERAEYYPKATEHIEDMKLLITRLIEKGHAYVKGGSVYFKIDSFPRYGELARLDLDSLKPGSRVDADEYNKEDVRDFSLWKAKKKEEPSWDSPWGEGRPGWHIECSAMSMHYLGATFDIHTGGVDNIFPHHENEIAQSEAATGKPFVRYWLHCKHLVVEGEKMSKSKGNFYTLRDLFSKGYDPLAIRYLLLATNYRKPLNFTFEGLKKAATTIERLNDFVDRLASSSFTHPSGKKLDKALKRAEEKFIAELDNDLNISGALGGLFELVRDANTAFDEGSLTEGDKERVLGLLRNWNRVLDVIEEPKPLPDELIKLVEKRNEARRSRDYKLSDEIRMKLLEKGIVLEDTKYGTRWRRR
jgi:cysteinyl-tRNA synthetase